MILEKINFRESVKRRYKEQRARAENIRRECVNKEIALDCPGLESVNRNKTDYHEIIWMVTDFKVKSQNRKWIPLGHCDENLACNRHRDIASFDQRIQIRNPVRGTLFVKQLILHDQLTYKCEIYRGTNRGPLVVSIINVKSSKNCLSTTAGESLDLSQPFRGTFPKETVEDMLWYRILKDRPKEKVAYCNPSLPCILETCNSSCPEYLTRLKTDGMSIILTDVKQADSGLEFQCEMYPETANGNTRVYIIRINDIVPRAAVGYVNGTIATSTNKTRGTATPTTNNRHNTGCYSTQNSWLLALIVAISLVIAPYGIS
ncbi:hypothetical protein OS493_011934 [Desmophyllum pertusum]|uniref:Uncharacterized protein n=1 Tax=Desmophyllum pertusum TaxID=174260 RepID=A0A9X0CH81_9CNID|nr:hypothetical protein OS493_011934 [Desmophyllum pertusum]